MKFKRTYYKIKYSNNKLFYKISLHKNSLLCHLIKKKKQNKAWYQKNKNISDLENNHRKNGKNFEKVI